MQDHTAQLFDTRDSVADAVSNFVRDGLLAGETVLVVATDVHWDAIRGKCREQGVDVTTALRAGWLQVRDAKDLLAEFMYRDRPEWSKFDATVGALVRQLTANGASLRVYGEMVDLLARANEFAAAQRLEEFWNTLARSHRFSLFCGYSAEHFGNPRDAGALQEICRLHSHVHVDPRDVLGSFLLKIHSAC